jgi:hypothetical protein
MAKRKDDWNFEEYGFKIINWNFPKRDIPHCEVTLKINTGLEKINEETYSFTSCSLPCDEQIVFLENLKKSAELAIKKIKKKSQSETKQ